MFSILLWIPVLAEEVSLDVFQAIERRTAVISSLPLFRPLFAPMVAGAGTHFHIERLQHHAALRGPEIL
jgi:hypothetical protein